MLLPPFRGQKEWFECFGTDGICLSKISFSMSMMVFCGSGIVVALVLMCLTMYDRVKSEIKTKKN